jgi:hypothetical protein
MTPLITGLIIGIVVSFVIGYLMGWITRTRLPTYGQYDTLLQFYIGRLHSAQRKARSALAMWDDGDLSGARHNIVEIAQLGEDK